jgi:chromate transporter
VNGTQTSRSVELRKLAGLFLRLGATAFGGPAAHIAMIEAEVVRRLRWLSREEFLDLLGATHLIPGPNSTEMAIHIGHRRAGWPGLVVAGVCFILPAALIVGVLAWAYVQVGARPQAEALLYGIKPVIIAVIVQALWSLGRTAIKTRLLALLGAAAVILNTWGVGEQVVLFGVGSLPAIARVMQGRNPTGAASIAMLGLSPPATIASFSMGALFLYFLKIGAILFGSGYVLLAFLRADLVEQRHWLTEAQLLDAIAIGQMTPGPVFTTATFIGYLLGGSQGAAVATIAIFLPAFVFVALSGPLIPRLRRSATAGAFLDGVNVASLALMAVVTWKLGLAAVVDPFTVLIAIFSTILLIRFRMNSAWLILGGAAAGFISLLWRTPV